MKKMNKKHSHIKYSPAQDSKAAAARPANTTRKTRSQPKDSGLRSRKRFWPTHKILIIIGIFVVYILIAVLMKLSIDEGLLKPGQDTSAANPQAADNDRLMFQQRFDDAQRFFNNHFVKNDGHILLYLPLGNDAQKNDSGTNSEAISYYLLWTARQGDKQDFDRVLSYTEQYMLHKDFSYLMWRIEENHSVVADGSNIASDADLRAIHALMIAEDRWREVRYSQRIDGLALGLERVAITDDYMLAPYAGISGEDAVWRAEEVWLSYADFQVFRELQSRRGEPWGKVYANMKDAVLKSQIHNGLYNPQITVNGEYGNGIDNSAYSINSMWIMVRAAESGDDELITSANRSLQFYKEKYIIDGQLYTEYTSNGDALTSSHGPWVYALVARAAIALGDEQFSKDMLRELVDYQIMNSTYAGAFPEGYGNELYVGQFTMQESILALQSYLS